MNDQSLLHVYWRVGNLAFAAALAALALFLVASVPASVEASGPETLGRTGWQVSRPYSPVVTPPFSPLGAVAFYDYLPGPVPAENDASWSNCGPGNTLCPNADTIAMLMPNGSRLVGSYGCGASADFTFFQSSVSIPEDTVITQFSVNMSGADDGARVAIYNSAHPAGFVFGGSYIFLGGAQSTTDLSSAMVAGEVNRVLVTQMDNCATGNNLAHAEISLNGTVIPTDGTPPVITPDVAGTLGNHGWYVSDVTVSWTVTDAESAVTATTGCDTTTVTADTAGVTFTCTATSAGGTASETVTLKRDATAPGATATRTPVANANGWNNTVVTVSFSGSDALSGIASCDADVVLGEGAGQSAGGTCTDLAGNVSDTATVSDINVDETVPAVTVTGVSDGATYIVGDEPEPGCTTTDALSGVTTEAAATVSGGPLGAITVDCSGAEDLAGNTAATSATYSVAYDFCGFEQPLLTPVQVFKVNSTIAVKFCLADAGGAAVGNAVAQVYANGVLQGTARYDANDEHYIFNLRTKEMAAGPLTISVSLDDGTTHSIAVALK